MTEISTGFATTAKTVGTSASQLLSASSAVNDLIVQNTHATQDLYVGASGVTTSSGFKIAAGTSYRFENFRGDLYGIASGAGTTVIVVTLS